MPSTSEIVLAAIAILAVTAIALLVAPTFVWIRRRMAGPGEQQKDLKTEGTLDPKAIARELVSRTPATTDDEDNAEAIAAATGPVTTDPALEDRIIRIVSW